MVLETIKTKQMAECIHKESYSILCAKNRYDVHRREVHSWACHAQRLTQTHLQIRVRFKCNNAIDQVCFCGAHTQDQIAIMLVWTYWSGSISKKQFCRFTTSQLWFVHIILGESESVDIDEYMFIRLFFCVFFCLFVFFSCPTAELFYITEARRWIAKEFPRKEKVKYVCSVRTVHIIWTCS